MLKKLFFTDMKDYFDNLRKINKDHERDMGEFDSYFESALFPIAPWDIETSKAPLVLSSTSEKIQAIKSLEKYVKAEGKIAEDKGEKKVSFSGGEIAVSSIECDIVYHCDENAPVVENELLAVFVGDLMVTDNDQTKVDEINLTLTKMIGAMGFSEGEFERKPSLRYFIDEEDEARTKKILDRFFSYLYKNQVKVVLTFGAIDTRSLIGKRDRLARIHGKFIDKEVSFPNDIKYSFKIVPIFHPEYLKVNPSMRRTTWEDLQEVMRYLNKT